MKGKRKAGRLRPPGKDEILIGDTFDPDNLPVLPEAPEPDEHETELARRAIAQHWPPKSKD